MSSASKYFQKRRRIPSVYIDRDQEPDDVDLSFSGDVISGSGRGPEDDEDSDEGSVSGCVTEECLSGRPAIYHRPVIISQNNIVQVVTLRPPLDPMTTFAQSVLLPNSFS